MDAALVEALAVNVLTFDVGISITHAADLHNENVSYPLYSPDPLFIGFFLFRRMKSQPIVWLTFPRR